MVLEEVEVEVDHLVENEYTVNFVENWGILLINAITYLIKKFRGILVNLLNEVVQLVLMLI